MTADGDPQVLSQSRMFLGGVIASAAYLLVVAILIDWGKAVALDPDRFATLVAGVFSPVGLFWLILSFRQQGHELRLQVQELRNTVEQQRELVAVTREQLTHEISHTVASQEERLRAARPILRIKAAGGGTSGNQRYFMFNLVNSGKDCTDVTIATEANFHNSPGVGWIPVIKTGETHTIQFEYEGQDVVPFELSVDYLDALGARGRALFSFSRSGTDVAPDLKVETTPISVQ